MIHWTIWTIWVAVAGGIARLAYRDWHDPREDRTVVALAAGTCAAVLAAAAGCIAVLT
jgi:hypothetical protein